MYSSMRPKVEWLAGLCILLGVVSGCGDDDALVVACNDPFATNYDPAAQGNEECQYPSSLKPVALLTELPAVLPEVSGLAPFNGLVIGHNDSGNPAKLFFLETSDGQIVHEIDVINGPNHDWEDLAHNESHLFIADVGNNAGNRQNLGIHRIPWTAFDLNQSTTVLADGTIYFRYPEQTSFSVDRHNFDCEASIYWNGHIYLFMKHRGDNMTSMYRVTAEPGPQQDAQLLGAFNSSGRITAADINEDGSEVILLGYLRSGNCFVWKLSDFEPGQFLAGRKERFVIGPFAQFGQMEGIVYSNDGGAYICSEEVSEFGLLPKLWFMDDI